MRKKVSILVSGAVIALVAVPVLGGSAMAAKPAKLAVCHYDDDGVPSAPKTLWVGSANAVAKHVANHTPANGHEGSDHAGVC